MSSLTRHDDAKEGEGIVKKVSNDLAIVPNISYNQ